MHGSWHARTLVVVCPAAGEFGSVNPSSGPAGGYADGGGVVSLAGQNLVSSAADLSSVTLCGVPAVVDAASSTLVVFRPPPGTAGAVCDIVVTSILTGVTTAVNAYSYNEGARS